LAAELGPGVIADVEVALHDRDWAQRPVQYVDPVSVAELIVTITTLAWTIYKDLRSSSQSSKPEADVMARRIRVGLPKPEPATAAQRDEVIDVVCSVTARFGEAEAKDLNS
jgi:hypothetical protein